MILQAVHDARLTGTLRARAGPRLVAVSFRAGEIVAAEALDSEGIDTLASFIEWTAGQFDFLAGEPARGGPVRGSFTWLMLEACRRADEARAAESAGAEQPAS